jgi:hypothetical protein
LNGSLNTVYDTAQRSQLSKIAEAAFDNARHFAAPECEMAGDRVVLSLCAVKEVFR